MYLDDAMKYYLPFSPDKQKIIELRTSVDKLFRQINPDWEEID